MTRHPMALSAGTEGCVEPPVHEAFRRHVLAWLVVVCALVLMMVLVGGITRLTGSGLSIVEWKPVVGALPPRTADEWAEAFQSYRQFPQYKLMNAGMTLGEFKRIFFWEYLHRLLGRLVGVAFFVPWVYFVVRRAFSRQMFLRLLLAFAMGGLQGAVGWFMVRSGLVDVPRVSHYRLATHLSLALVVVGYIWWNILDIQTAAARVLAAPRRIRLALGALLALVGIQIVYGAFTAGLHAGIGYNTFPKMHGRWVPSEAFALVPTWRNVFENPATVQFLHRLFGTLLALSVAFVWALSRRSTLDARLRKALNMLLVAVVVQYALGVGTLVLVVPIVLAVAHQLTASLVLLVCLLANHAASFDVRHEERASLRRMPDPPLELSAETERCAR